MPPRGVIFGLMLCQMSAALRIGSGVEEERKGYPEYPVLTCGDAQVGARCDGGVDVTPDYVTPGYVTTATNCMNACTWTMGVTCCEFRESEANTCKMYAADASTYPVGETSVLPGGSFTVMTCTGTFTTWPPEYTTQRYIPPVAPTTTQPPTIGGDPHVVNYAGQKFDVLRVGTFALLALGEIGSNEPLLAVHGTIDRITKSCADPTFISNISLTGKWIQENSIQKLGVRAVHWKKWQTGEALEVGFNDEWQSASGSAKAHSLLTTATRREVGVEIHGVKVNIKLGRNNRPGPNYDYNHLNLRFEGISALDNKISMSGLLAQDDFQWATQSNCEQPSKIGFSRLDTPLKTSGEESASQTPHMISTIGFS